MRLLKSIYFLNSASMLYTQVNLNGNIHITGKNGSGKTSILRAILFFYNPDTQNLGIGSNQKNFTEFYFPQTNSYIVYEVQKEDFTYLIIAFKKQNRVYFKVVEAIFKRDSFIKDNQIMSLQDILQGFHGERKFVSNNIEKYKDFKSLIYGTNNEFKRYSIFDSKGINYQSIPRTIGNIFLNYKLDSLFIKHSIINSIMEEPPSINLISLKHQLGNFDKHYKDIKAFNSHSRSAKNIVESYTELLQLGNSKKQFAGMLGYKVDNSNIEKFKIDAEIKVLNLKLKELIDNLKVLESEHNKEEQKFNFNIQTLENKVKEAQEKDKAYQEIKIDEIIKAVESKQSLQRELETSNSDLNLLQSENLDISTRYKIREEEVIHNLKKEENDCKQKENTLLTQVLKDKEEIRSSTEKLITETKRKYDQLFIDIGKNKKVVTDSLVQLNHQYSETKYSEPLKEEIDKISQSLEVYKKEIGERNSIFQNLEGKLELAKKDLTFKSEKYNLELNQLEEKHNFKLKELNNRLLELIQKLQSAEESFSGFLEKSYQGYEENIAKLVSEDILFSTRLEPEIKQKSDLFFGISLNLSELPKAKTINDYKDEKERTANHIATLNDQHKNNLEKLKSYYKSEQDILEKKILEHEKTQSKIKKEILERNILQQNNEFRLNKTKNESSDIKAQKIEVINSDISNEKAKLNKFEQDETDFKFQLNNAIKNFDDNKQSKINNLESNYNSQIKELKENLEQFKKINSEKRLEIQADYQKELQDKGTDPTKITELQRRISVINSKLKFIEDNTQKYYDYLSDKAKLIDKVEDFKEEIKHLNSDKAWHSNEFKSKESIILEEINKSNTKLEGLKQSFYNLENELKTFQSFKQISLFNELSEYIINEKYFIDNQESISNIITKLNSIKTQLLENANTLREKITKYTDKFDDNNIFAFNRNNYSDKDFVSFASNLDNFIQDERIKEYENEMITVYSLIISNLSQQMNEINSKEGEIQKTITKINSSFEKTRLIDVIKDIELKVKPSNNRIIHFLNKIREFNEQNPFAGEFNLFNQSSDKGSEDKAINLLNNLKQSIEESKSDKVSLEESFEIEFRIKENNNDTGFIERLSNIGSNGTDVLVKAMIYITLLDVAKSRLKIKDFKIHCIVDEVGILDNNYLKYLIQFANEKDILLINGSPNPAFLYDYIYRVNKDQKSNSIVRLLIEMKRNEITSEFSQDTATVN